MEHLLLARQSGNGSNRGGGSNSLSGIISTLAPTFIISVLIFAAFLILRPKADRVYRPRSLDYVVHQQPRQTRGKSGLLNFKGLPDDYVLHHNSLDGYLFLRFFKLLIFISFVGCCITWPVLFPINVTGGGGQKQLDILSFSNVKVGNRYYAQAVVAWVFLGFVMLAITHERLFFVGVRQAYYMSPLRAKRLTSRTVLFMNLPKGSNEESMRELLGRSVRRVWMVTDCKKLQKNVENRDKAANKLEGAETKMITNAHKTVTKEGGKQGTNAQALLDGQKKRPKHRLTFLIGKKVDTIDWCRDNIPKMTTDIKKEQNLKLEVSAPKTAAFIEFESQAAAQKAFQLAGKSKKKQYQPRFIDVEPNEIIWKNLGMSWATRKGLTAVATVLVVLVVLFWTPITAFVGALANINYLTNKIHFLSFINHIPTVILGVVTGLLPVIVLAVCVALVPILMRLLAKFSGAATLSEVELKTQSWYFIFQVIQVFLITTFVSGAAAVTTQIINNPSSAPSLLATNLPKASNFYISYFILFGLMQAALQLLLIVPFLMKTIVGGFLDSTPRKKYNRWTSLAGLGWGSEYPKWTNLGVIALSYSCISPLLLGFSTIGFLLLYIAFRENWLFVFGNNIDMKGAAYSKALSQLTVGIYLSTICLIGLFGIGAGQNVASVGPLVLMVVFLVVLIVFQVLVDRAVSPLEKHLPMDMLEENESSTFIHEKPSHGTGTLQNGQNRTNGYHSPAAHEEATAKDNMLTKRLRPIIHSRFFTPLNDRAAVKDSAAALEDDIKDPQQAYLNPVITSPEPLIWLPRDSMGVSRVLIQGNKAKGVRSTDEYAWLDEKSKPVWDTSRAFEVEAMLKQWQTQSSGDGEGPAGNNKNDYATGAMQGAALA